MLKAVLTCSSRLTLAEASGSLGDLGILIPLLVGMAHQGCVDFVPALFFAGLWNLLTGLLWDVPMCVQSMKTIAAVALADGLTRVQFSLAGMLVGLLVLLLGLTRGVVVVTMRCRSRSCVGCSSASASSST